MGSFNSGLALLQRGAAVPPPGIQQICSVFQRRSDAHKVQRTTGQHTDGKRKPKVGSSPSASLNITSKYLAVSYLQITSLSPNVGAFRANQAIHA